MMDHEKWNYNHQMESCGLGGVIRCPFTKDTLRRF